MVRKVYLKKKKKRHLETTSKNHRKFAPVVLRPVMASKFTLHFPDILV